MIPDISALERVRDPEIPRTLGALEEVRATLWARLTAPIRRETDEGPEIANDARLLTARELSERLGMSRRWVYRNRKKLGGKKLGTNVRFTEGGLKRYLAERR